MVLAQILEGATEGVRYVYVEPGRLEFMIVLIGVVIGLSIGRLVNFSAEIVVQRDNVTWNYSFLVYLMALFLYQVLYWWWAWDLKEFFQKGETTLTFLSYLRLLLVPLLLYQATAVLCKDLRDKEPFDMREHFEHQARAFYLIVAALIITVSLQDYFLFERTWENHQTEIIIRGAALIIVFVALAIRPRVSHSFHFLLALIILLLLCYFIYDQAIAPDLARETEHAMQMVPPQTMSIIAT